MRRGIGHAPVMPTFEVEGREARWERTGVMRGRPMYVFAHGAGAPMTSPFMDHVTEGLVERDVCVVRFHFPYMEQMVASDRRRGPDGKKVLLATWRGVLDEIGKMRDHGPIVIGGKSMGGRYASMLAARGDAPEACGLVYLGYPLHAAGKPDKMRSEHLPEVALPQLFVQGTKDPLCDLRRLRRVLKRVPDARLVTVRGGDHSLAPSRKDPFARSDSWLDEIAEFIRDVT